MNNKDIQDKLKEFVRSFNGSDTNIERDANLFSESLLDSLQAIDYMIMIDEEFHVDMSMKIIEEHKLGTISAMAEYIENAVKQK